MNVVWNEPSAATTTPRFTGRAAKSISTTPQDTQKPVPFRTTVVPPGPRVGLTTNLGVAAATPATTVIAASAPARQAAACVHRGRLM